MTSLESKKVARKGKPPNTERLKPHWIEWLTGAVSSLLILAIIGWVSYEAVNGTDTPAELRVDIASIEKTGAGWRVLFDLSNSGEATAAAVEVRGTVTDRGRFVEEAAVIFDYVAARSIAHGALIFTQDPAGRDLNIRAVGFNEP
ncbi:Conserved hypothetical protein CHP02588 [Rhizobium sp. PDO1-076]|uniref:TIGR02588 family protein n=1 Tax=Rhizobium sp. PDO1-076 TaxID=1125979 RepID=UPI00024E3272|nr:TIGR02588 family protein [Rhizobium sp. PDO1-076]EHS51598.1 Conserved hypothetical protein CHP02588 [Rhizobium sp. PDO1-076]